MTILVTGANGQLGRLVVDSLRRRAPAAPLAVSVRDPGRAGDLADAGIDVRHGDFDTADTLARAFADIDTLLIVSGDAPVEARIRQHRTAVDAARAAGVGRVVYTSFVDPRPDSPFPFAAIHADTEVYLKASGLAYTLLRNGVYADNLLGFVGRALESGTLAAPAGDGKVAFISRADLAEATANVLLGDGHVGRTYELTGPAAIGFQDVADAVSRHTGREIAYRSIPTAAFEDGLTQAGLPPFMVTALGGMFRSVATGDYRTVTTDAAGLLGREPESLDAVLARALD
ncbi:SDR family oxidoreductase [Thalassobaculum fulvum]|nr:SDR family oxidoreductase [Thalassobaculum fulvum]